MSLFVDEGDRVVLTLAHLFVWKFMYSMALMSSRWALQDQGDKSETKMVIARALNLDRWSHENQACSRDK